MTNKHTPTPWRYLPNLTYNIDQRDGFAYPYLIYAGAEFVAQIATDQMDDKADGEVNAALIVRAVNSHDALVAALHQAIAQSGYCVSGPTDHRAAEHGEPVWVCNARAALAKAEG